MWGLESQLAHGIGSGAEGGVEQLHRLKEDLLASNASMSDGPLPWLPVAPNTTICLAMAFGMSLLVLA